MGFIVDAAKSVLKVIGDAVSSVVHRIAHAVTQALNWISEHALAILAVVIVVIAIVTYNYEILAANISIMSAELAAGTMTYLEAAGLTIQMFGYSIYYSVTAFLAAIHFGTLLKIHQIAYLLSTDYRTMIAGVYNQIATVSKALGLESGYFVLALRNARSTILDVSGMMGRSYDLGEVTWLTNLSSYLKVFNKKAIQYQNNPGKLLLDIDQLLIKPATDLKGSIMGNVFTILDSTSLLVKDTVTEVDKLRHDLGKMIHDLPESIRDQTAPVFAGVFKKYDTWIKNEYGPAVKQFDKALSIFNQEQSKHKAELTGLVNRLKHPADYLAEIDKFDSALKIDQENRISEISNRSFVRDSNIITEGTAPAKFEYQKLAGALKAAIPQPAWYRKELTTPGRPAGAVVEKRKTWFVGDY